MAEFNFGDMIMRSIQNQDELNAKKQEMNLEQSRFNAQMGQQNREYSLQMAKFVNEQQNQQFTQNLDIAKYGQKNQEIDIQNQSLQERKQNDFDKSHIIYNAIPDKVKKSIPQSDITVKDGKQYVDENIVTTALRSIGLDIAAEKANKEKDNNDPDAPVKVDEPTKTLKSDVEAAVQNLGTPTLNSKININAGSDTTAIKTNINKVLGRYDLVELRNNLADYLKNNPGKTLNDAINEMTKNTNVNKTEESILRWTFKYMDEKGNLHKAQ